MHDPLHYRSWSAFQAYPICWTIGQTPRMPEVSRTRRRINQNNCKRATRGSHPIRCFGSRNSSPERREQPHRHEDESDRTFFLSSEFAFILTLVVTAASGGPVLATWGVFFLILGKYTGAPPWLQVLSTFLFASITDILTHNWASTSLDSGYTPFFVFLLGSGAAALYESAALFPPAGEVNSLRAERAAIPESETVNRDCHDSKVDEIVMNDDEELADWDQAFRETHRNKDTAS